MFYDCMTFDTTWRLYSEYGPRHSGTVGGIEILKMAATNLKIFSVKTITS